jgi:hypothetical protein
VDAWRAWGHGGLELWNLELISYFQIVSVLNNSQVERTFRNFKEKEVETDQNGKIIPEEIPEGDLPF